MVTPAHLPVAQITGFFQLGVNGHPFDGDKQLGWLATAVFLELNGIAASEADNDEVYEHVYSVAEGSPTVEAIGAPLKRVCSPPR